MVTRDGKDFWTWFLKFVLNKIKVDTSFQMAFLIVRKMKSQSLGTTDLCLEIRPKAYINSGKLSSVSS